MELSKKLGAEFIGTFWLVFGGVGSAVIAGTIPEVGIGLLGIALAFGLSVMAMVYAVGGISGGHFNPAVSIGLWAGGRFSSKELLPYILAQVAGAIFASIVLYIIASGTVGYDGRLGSNGYGEGSLGGYSYMAGLVMEIIMTFIFLFVILGVTDKRAPAGFAGISIGLTLTLIHLVSIPVTQTSVNPARSTGPALIEYFVKASNGGLALSQLWFFWVMPIIGALLAGFVYRWFQSKD
jgi:aquaporin Z